MKYETIVDGAMNPGNKRLICARVKSRYIGDGHPTFNRNPYNGYINPYHWVDDHPLLYGNNGSLDPGTYGESPLFAIRFHIPSSKLTARPWKIPIFPGKYHQNGGFSMAMLVYRSVSKLVQLLDFSETFIHSPW